MALDHLRSESPLVAHIADIIEGRIRTEEYPNGKWLPSERELAAEFEVSQIVIRSVVRELESKGLVLRAPRCRPVVQKVQTAKKPPNGKLKNVGVWLWPRIFDPGTSSVLRGIQQELSQEEFRLVIASASNVGTTHDSWDDTLRSEREFLELRAEDEGMAGILLWCLGGEASLPSLRKVRAAGIPVIFMDRLPPPGFEADYVGVDNERAARQVVRHLASEGHRRIAHMTNVDNASTVRERLAGYRDALRLEGIPFREDLVLTETTSTSEEPNVHEALADRLLSLSDPPTAVFVVNDDSALRLLAALRARGVRVPEDIAVASFDGIERFMPGPSFLTTVIQPFDQLGERAVGLLLRRIEMGPEAPYQHILLDAPLSVHGSTRRENADSGGPDGS
ncbi:MAG: GntR family transcriptional regulator [Armatimonadetes bacterium]|nr:GntR family transcriptional regulator [Armatimonadota bacterium]